jgi:hypothetical protein
MKVDVWCSLNKIVVAEQVQRRRLLQGRRSNWIFGFACLNLRMHAVIIQLEVRHEPSPESVIARNDNIFSLLPCDARRETKSRSICTIPLFVGEVENGVEEVCCPRFWDELKSTSVCSPRSRGLRSREFSLSFQPPSWRWQLVAAAPSAERHQGAYSTVKPAVHRWC